MTGRAPAFAPGPTIDELLLRYRTGTSSPLAVVEAVLAAIEARGDDGVWIQVARPADLFARAAELELLPTSLPLYGIPFGVKDSIDVAGWPTTLACPEYSRVASETAPVVQAILAAGGIFVGKTNLDQFASGLNGTRTGYTLP